MRIVSLPKNWLPLFQRFCAIYTRMGQPQQINDNKGMFETGTLKTQKRKTRDEKTRHQNAGVENARLEHAAPYCNHRKRRTGKLIMRMLFEWRKTLINVTDEKELGCFAKTEKSSHIIATGAAIPRTIAMPTVTLLHTHWKKHKGERGPLKRNAQRQHYIVWDEKKEMQFLLLLQCRCLLHIGMHTMTMINIGTPIPMARPIPRPTLLSE